MTNFYRDIFKIPAMVFLQKPSNFAIGLLFAAAVTFLPGYAQTFNDQSNDLNQVGYQTGRSVNQSVQYVDGYRIAKGERPPVNLDKVTEEDYQKGVLLIKFHRDLTNHLDEVSAARTQERPGYFGIESADRLNESFGVREIIQHFSLPALKSEFTARHRAWGFHLWYELRFDDGADILSMVKEYGALREVEIAEPVFKKALIDYGVTAVHTHDWIKDLARSREMVRETRIVSKPDSPEYSREPQAARIAEQSHKHTDWVKSGGWTPDDQLFGDQWHYHNTGQTGGTLAADIDLVRAWEIEKGHPDVVVAIIDDGIQYDHPDLAGNMWPGIGYNFVDDNSAVISGQHGTHVAGTVAAVSNNVIGVAGVAGGSGSDDGVRLMSCQVFAGNRSGGFHLAPVWAADNGAAISQNSWGYTMVGAYNQAVLDAIDYFNENAGGDVLQGGITIFAAGNNNASGAWYPAYYSGALSVAATNHNDIKASYSNFDVWIDLAAPGGDGSATVLSTLINNSYGCMMGTSMACPHVSGVAALLVSYAHRNFDKSTLHNHELWDLLTSTTDNIDHVNPIYKGLLGSGRLNAYNALRALQDIYKGVTNPMSFSAESASSAQIDLTWEKNTDNHDVMLVWSADNNFGKPVDGTVYSIGATLPGGGTILYSGGGTTFAHTGLDPATTHFYKIFSYDGMYDYSSGRNTNETTACGAVTDLPFVESFENDSEYRSCWTLIQETGTGVWTYVSGALGGRIIEAKHGQLNARFVSQAGNNSPITKLVSPVLDLSALSSPRLTFYLGQQSWFGDQNETKVYARKGPNEPWLELIHVDYNINNWKHFRIPLPDHSSAYQIAFEGINNYGWANVLDQVVVEESPACPDPYNLTAEGITVSEASLSWTPGGFETSWNVEVGLQGFSPGTGTEIAGVQGTQDNPLIITGLDSNTSYEFYVQADCSVSGNGLSTWSEPHFFKTACHPFLIPYANDFPTGDFPDCWNQSISENLNYKSWGMSNSSFAGGSAWEMAANWQSGVGVSRLVAPVMDLSSEAYVFLEFEQYFKDYAHGVTLKIQTSSDGIHWVDEDFIIHSGQGNIGPETISLPLSTLSETTHIAWVIDGDHFQFDNWFIDDVRISTEGAIIEINPTSFHVILTQDATTTRQLQISNEQGAAPLHWSTGVSYQNPVKTSAGEDEVGLVRQSGKQHGVELPVHKLTEGGDATDVISEKSHYDVLHYDGPNSHSWGWAEGGVFHVAARFPLTMVESYIGYLLESVDVYIGCLPSESILYIWGTGDASTPGSIIHQQTFLPVEHNWNKIIIDQEVQVGASDLWVGYSASHDAGKPPSGSDSGPGHPDGGYYSGNGVDWHIDLDVNWNIRAYLEPEFPWITLHPASGTVPPGEIIYADLQFDVTGMELGTYYAEIQLNHDGVTTEKSNMSIPVQVTIVDHYVDEHVTLEDVVVIPDDGPVCFDAIETITTGGVGGYFIVEDGAYASLIAGESIHMLPGTHVKPGGYLHAYITATGDYCAPIVKEELEEEWPEEFATGIGDTPLTEREGTLFRVFPNPTTGSFTLELCDWLDSERIFVEVFNTLGSRVLHATLPPGRQHALSLTGQQPGIYVVRVVAGGDKVGVERIIKR